MRTLALAVLGAIPGLLAPAPTGAGAVSLKYLGHACFLITAPGGTRLLIDPYASGEWPGLVLPPATAEHVLVTHSHWDHAAWRAVRGDPKLMDGPGTLQGDDFAVQGIAGRHADTGGKGIGHRNTIFVVETGGLRFCHLGDNGPLGEGGGPAAEIGAVDVLMIPIDSEKRVLTYEQAKAWITALSPRIVVPMHYRVPGVSLEQVAALGTLQEWLSGQEGFVRLASDTLTFGAGRETPDLPPKGARAVRVLTLVGERAVDPVAPVAGRAEAAEAKRSAEVAVAEGDLATALAEFTRAAALDPADAEVMQKIGFLHLGGARPDRALEFLERAAQLAGTDSRRASLSWLGAGMALDLMARRPEAIAAYEKVIALGVNDEHQVDQARRYRESPYRED